jgi:uncharacterized protein YlxW (UPF0749 family)
MTTAVPEDSPPDRSATDRGAGDRPGENGGQRRFSPDFLTEIFRNPLDPGYADAARRRAQQPDTPARRTSGLAARTVSLIAIGFLLVVAYQQTVKGAPESSRTREGLVNTVRSAQSETDQLQHRAEQLRDQVAKQRDEALTAAGADADTLSRVEVAAGTTKVHGSGAVVELNDAPTPVDPVTGKATGQNLGMVLDRDLQDVANELWHDGAEAIAINGERLTATSTIRTAGITILVDFRPITAPYQVQAIGPADLDKSFNNSLTGARFRAYVTNYGMKVAVKKQGDLTLPAAADPQLHYAQPVPSSSPSTAVTGSPVPSTGGR